MEAHAAVHAILASVRQRRAAADSSHLRRADQLAPRTQDALDRITRRAAELLGVTVACASLLDNERRLLTSGAGLSAELALLLSWPLCQRVIATRQPLAIADARKHALMAKRPAVRDGMVMSYAGAPLIASDGRAMGALFVMTPKPRAWTNAQLALLGDLAAELVSEVEQDLVAARPSCVAVS